MIEQATKNSNLDVLSNINSPTGGKVRSNSKKENGFGLAGKVMMQRTISHAVKASGKNEFRDDISLGKKSAIIEDPMVSQAKEREALNKGQFPITRICLTGGPCAGKTTALATLSLHLKQIGYRVLQVPEAATILMKGGAFIQTGKMLITNAVKF